MKAIILAAGQGQRMRPLTLTTPKCLLKYGGQTNLDHIFVAFPSEIDEVIIVVKYLGEQIKDYCKDNFHGRKISYVQGTGKGTAVDFMATSSFFKQNERLTIIYGDEVLTSEEIAMCLEHEFSWLCYKVSDPTQVGVATLDHENNIIEIIEKPARSKSNFAVNGFMVVNSDLFNCQPEAHNNGEYYLTSMMNKFIKNYKVIAIMGSVDHTQLTFPVDLEQLEKMYAQKNLSNN